jgi:hypothetical protein
MNIVTMYRAKERGASMAHLTDSATWTRKRSHSWWGSTLCGLYGWNPGNPAQYAPAVPATCRRCLAIAAKREVK